MCTSLPERGSPGRTTVGSRDFADVDEVRLSTQPLEAAVGRVQPLFVGQHARDRSQVL